jgi:hypothetical protein
MKDKLVIFDKGDVWRIGWYLADEQDMGATLGEDADSMNCGDDDHDAATNAIIYVDGARQHDVDGWYWETKAAAKNALSVANAAIKALKTSKNGPAKVIDTRSNLDIKREAWNKAQTEFYAARDNFYLARQEYSDACNGGGV